MLLIREKYYCKRNFVLKRIFQGCSIIYFGPNILYNIIVGQKKILLFIEKWSTIYIEHSWYYFTLSTMLELMFFSVSLELAR